MTFISTRRAVAAIVAAACLAIPASASAMPYSPPTTTRSDAAQSRGDAKLYSVQPQTGSKVPVPDDAPTTIEVVRPERTIVRDVDQALPLILSSTALLLVLTGLGVTLVRARMMPRPGPNN